MSKRYLEVTVSRKQTSTVFLEVDADDPRFAGLWDAKFPERMGLFDAVEPFVAPAVDETVADCEWEIDLGGDEPPYFEVEVEGVKEVSEREGTSYATYEVPPLSTAEKRELLEEAGQLTLLEVA